MRQVSPVSFEIANSKNLKIPLGVYHTSALTPYLGQEDGQPHVEIKKRGRPPKKKPLLGPGSESG